MNLAEQVKSNRVDRKLQLLDLVKAVEDLVWDAET